MGTEIIHSEPEALEPEGFDELVDEGEEVVHERPAPDTDQPMSAADLTAARIRRKQLEARAGKDRKAEDVPAAPEASAGDEEGGEEEAAEEETDDEDEDEADEEEREDDAPEPVEPPQFWSKEERETFAALPREAQEIIARREKDSVAAVNAKFQEAASKIKEATEQERAALGEALDRAKLMVSSRFANVDDEQIAQAVQRGHITKEEAFDVARERDEALANLRELEEAHTKALEKAEAIETAERVKERKEFLGEHAPELLSDQALLTSVIKFATDRGYEPDELKAATGRDLLLLRDAYLYRTSKSVTEKKKAAAKPAPQKVLKPKAGSAPAAQSSKRLKALESKGRTQGLTPAEATQLRLLKKSAARG